MATNIEEHKDLIQNAFIKLVRIGEQPKVSDDVKNVNDDPRTTSEIKEDVKKKIALLVERYVDELMSNTVTYEEDLVNLEHVISIQEKLS